MDKQSSKITNLDVNPMKHYSMHCNTCQAPILFTQQEFDQRIQQSVISLDSVNFLVIFEDFCRTKVAQHYNENHVERLAMKTLADDTDWKDLFTLTISYKS